MGLPLLGVVVLLAVESAVHDVFPEPVFVPSHREVPERRELEHR